MPKADRYGALRKVLATPRLPEKKVLEATAAHLTEALFAEEQPTSLGRWLESHLEDFDALWKSADERGQAALAGFLLRRKPKAFDARLSKLAFKHPAAQVELALAMLAVDAAKYGPQALRWLEGLSSPRALLETAEPLFASQPEVARKLAVQALGKSDPERTYEYGIDATRLPWSTEEGPWDPRLMLQCMRDEIAFFTSKNMLAEFACLFFAAPKRQAWLKGLAGECGVDGSG